MAGKMCTGKNENSSFNPNQSRAYCEGMTYRASGTALEKPVFDNPQPAGSEANAAWTRGWNVANGNTGGFISKADLGCCASVGLVPL